MLSLPLRFSIDFREAKLIRSWLRQERKQRKEENEEKKSLGKVVRRNDASRLRFRLS